jgi:hypothetical protein
MEDMEGWGQEARESWSWVGGTTAAQGDPVGSAVEAGGPFVFSRRFTACKVETIDRPPNPGDETWVAASREYRMTYVTHAEASFGDPTTAEFSEHRKRIEEGLVPLRVGVAVPAGGDEAMKRMIDVMAIRELLRAAGPIIDRALGQLPEVKAD